MPVICANEDMVSIVIMMFMRIFRLWQPFMLSCSAFI